MIKLKDQDGKERNEEQKEVIDHKPCSSGLMFSFDASKTVNKCCILAEDEYEVNPIPPKLWKDVITRGWAIMAHIEKMGFNACKKATNQSKLVFKYIFGPLSFN